MEDLDLVERERVIYYKGKMILINDWSNLHGDEALRIIALHSDALIRRGRRNILNLVDVTGGFVNKEVLSALKADAKETQYYYKKIAVIGVVGVLQYFLHIVNAFSGIGVKAFSTEEEALEWLIT
ncbi:MAG: STAS/SEC14 domain-containing protein [Proteobacteria bacterium]|nr:STAS/SEC14 domain-containing protein [Pseudomonadota bacterium]